MQVNLYYAFKGDNRSDRPAKWILCPQIIILWLNLEILWCYVLTKAKNSFKIHSVLPYCFGFAGNWGKHEHIYNFVFSQSIHQNAFWATENQSHESYFQQWHSANWKDHLLNLLNIFLSEFALSSFMIEPISLLRQSLVMIDWWLLVISPERGNGMMD